MREQAKFAPPKPSRRTSQAASLQPVVEHNNLIRTLWRQFRALRRKEHLLDVSAQIEYESRGFVI